jgi:hypothetical protein
MSVKIELNNLIFYETSILVGIPEGKRQLGIPRRRWENNIKKDFQKIEYGLMKEIELVQDRDRWRTLMN